MTIKEMFKALGKGKKLIYTPTREIMDANSMPHWLIQAPEKFEVYIELEDLKRVFKEGARIEYYCVDWIETSDPKCDEDVIYRILGGITIEQWDKHKDSIKAFWDGAEIEYKTIDGSWIITYDPGWLTDTEYRSKPSKWEMKPALWCIYRVGSIHPIGTNYVSLEQKFGMGFHTEEAAQKARAQMRRANLLRYWVSTMQSLDEGDWFIRYNGLTNKYEPYMDRGELIGVVKMTKKTVRKICDALNSGELKL